MQHGWLMFHRQQSCAVLAQLALEFGLAVPLTANLFVTLPPVQALQCCLGVKASDTGRANTFKKLIRTGADEAIIRITREHCLPCGSHANAARLPLPLEPS